MYKCFVVNVFRFIIISALLIPHSVQALSPKSILSVDQMGLFNKKIMSFLKEDRLKEVVQGLQVLENQGALSLLFAYVDKRIDDVIKGEKESEIFELLKLKYHILQIYKEGYLENVQLLMVQADEIYRLNMSQTEKDIHGFIKLYVDIGFALVKEGYFVLAREATDRGRVLIYI